MHRSSESIASLAGALAKAQAELVNPEKSLVGTVRLDSRSDAERSFRYAPLSSGLDIVRKTLGLHEIATLADDRHRSVCRHRQPDNGTGALFGRMDCLGLAGMLAQRYGHAAADGSGAHLCTPVCAVHARRDCR